jgi:hypothetical protein
MVTTARGTSRKTIVCAAAPTALLVPRVQGGPFQGRSVCTCPCHYHFMRLADGPEAASARNVEAPTYVRPSKLPQVDEETTGGAVCVHKQVRRRQNDVDECRRWSHPACKQVIRAGIRCSGPAQPMWGRYGEDTARLQEKTYRDTNLSWLIRYNSIIWSR